MPGDDALSDVLARIEFLLAEPVDFSRTDSEATATKVRLLAAAAAYFNVLAVSDFDGREVHLGQRHAQPRALVHLPAGHRLPAAALELYLRGRQAVDPGRQRGAH